MASILKILLQKSLDLISRPLRDPIRRLPGVAAMQRWVFHHYIGGTFDYRVNDGPAAGAVFPLSLPADKLIWTGTYEMVLAKAVQEAVRPGDVCMDIGAFRGYFGALMARAGASAVYLFEPNPRNHPRLQRLVELNSDLPLHLFNLALGAELGTAEFYVLKYNTMGKLSTSRFETPEVVVDEVRWVIVETIDHLLGTGMPPPDVIKVDVEGAEADVLAGAEGMLEMHHPVWFIEAHTPELARTCTELLERHGYSVTLLGSDQSNMKTIIPGISHLVARLD